MRSQDVKENGIVGKIFFPETAEKRPAIIVLSGSDGGIYDGKAQKFAEAGYVGFALGYFRAEGLPQVLENIPLEYFLKAIHWLKSLPEVDPNKIHLYGTSRGGELVLLLASMFNDQFASCVAIVPGCATFMGIPDQKKASWTWQGEPLPIAPSPHKKDVAKQLKTKGIAELSPLFLKEIKKNKEAFEKAFIKVENIRCPILLISAQDDKMWPSSWFSELIMKRLDEFQSSIPREHLSYEKTGHMITSPYAPVMTKPFQHPATGVSYEMGGEPDAQAFACKDAWEKTFQFFARFS